MFCILWEKEYNSVILVFQNIFMNKIQNFDCSADKNTIKDQMYKEKKEKLRNHSLTPTKVTF